MIKFLKKTVAKQIAIAFFFTSLFIVITFFLADEKIAYYSSLLNTFAINKVETNREVVYNHEIKRLVSYPSYGEEYAKLKIDAINMNLPIVHGDSLDILSYAVGHYAGSYFPGEGGSIILAAHNTAPFFKKVDQLVVGDKIIIDTKYGIFEYVVDHYKVVKETDLEAFPIQNDKEMLIMYTCYPINRSVIGRRTERYVVYAYKVGE